MTSFYFWKRIAPQLARVWTQKGNCEGSISLHIQGFVEKVFRVGDLQITSVLRSSIRLGHPSAAPRFAKTFSPNEKAFKTAVEPVLTFNFKKEKKCTEIEQAQASKWPVRVNLIDCVEINRENSLYESEVLEIPYEIAKENEYNLPTIIKSEAKPLSQKTTNLEARAFTKMDSLFFPDLLGSFDFQDTLPDDPWIDNTVFSVQNLDIPEPNITAQEVLEETILSPAENLLSKEQELDHFFSEEFINLAAIESNMNSFNTLPTTATSTDIMGNIFGDFMVNNKEEATGQIKYSTSPEKPEPIPQSNLVPDPIPDFDSTAVVPNVFPSSPESVPDSPVDTTDSGIFANNFPLDISQFDPAILTLLDNLEKSTESNVASDNRKRALVEDKSADQLETPVCKKKKKPPCIAVEDEEIVDKVVARRVKNNAASRVCRASRKARHEDLFRQEKELCEENQELANKVKELSATVEYLRSYLVNRLSGQCN